MSKYNHLKSAVHTVSHEHPDWGSDKIAEFLATTHRIDNIGSFARTIRHKDWLRRKPFKQARILVYDIETSPNLSYHFGIWNQNIRTENIVKPWCILTWSAKWLFEDEVMSDKITSEEVEDRNDERVVRSLWSLLDEADIVIAHNAKKFDNKVANARFLKYGIQPPSFYETIDTLVHSRKAFKHDSNRLDDICKFLGFDGKMETPQGLWREAVEGDEAAIALMDEYCQQDVRILEDVYVALRAWIKPHPNIGLLEDTQGTTCPHCGSNNLVPDGDYRTYVNVYDNFRCNDCHGTSRSRVSSLSKQKRDNLLVSNPSR